MKARSIAVLDPLRSKALLAYSRMLPSWAHPFIDLLEPHASLVDSYLRLVLLDTCISLSAAIFIRIVLGQLVPAESIGLILLAGTAFAALNILNGKRWQPSCHRIQLALYAKIYGNVRRVILPNLFHPRRLAFLGTETANSSVIAPARAATLCTFSLLPLISDAPAITLMVAIFILVAGWSYAPILLVYALYIAGDLFLSYTKRKINSEDNSSELARSLLRTYNLNKRSLDESKLFQQISPLIFSSVNRDVDLQLKQAGSVEEELVGTQNTSDLISVILLVWVTTLVVSGNGSNGQLLAGVLVLMRLTPLVKKAYADYATVRKEAVRMRWFDGVYNDIKRENRAIASRTLPVVLSGVVTSVTLKNVTLRIPTPTIPSSSPQLLSANLVLNNREMVVVVGRSGSSKSTLLRVLTGVYPISGGQCLINGYDVQQLSETELRKRVIYLDSDCCCLPYELSHSLNEPPERCGDRWLVSEMECLLSTEGLMVALDQPELWLHQADPQRNILDTLKALASRHLLVVATRDEEIVNLADRMLVMEAGRCSESHEFRKTQTHSRSASKAAVTTP
jgi:ABC-type bacteriocin/lantibiotic exporter with double-glycine peptidase domain